MEAIVLATLEGVYPVVPTPFLEDGSIDEESIKRLVTFEHEQGVQGLTVLGFMGEAHKLLPAERRQTLEAFARAINGQMQLVAGTGADATGTAINLSLQAEEVGAGALLVRPPRVQDDRVIFEYFRRLNEAVSIPIIVHDYPASTGILLSPQLIAHLFEELEHVEYVKLEDPPTGPKISEVLELTGGKLRVLGALGGLHCLEELQRGAVGIMTGFSYPAVLVKIFADVKAGRLDEASDLFYRYTALIRYEFQPKLGIAFRKEILRQNGIFSTRVLRHPGKDLDQQSIEDLRRIQKWLGVS